MAQVVQYLYNKCEAMSSIPSTANVCVSVCINI
jgi:hypothetical protein